MSAAEAADLKPPVAKTAGERLVALDALRGFDILLLLLLGVVSKFANGPMPGLMAIAEDVQKVHAICVRCGSLANHSHRLSDSKKLVVLGEKESYEPLCRECYYKAIEEDKA